MEVVFFWSFRSWNPFFWTTNLILQISTHNWDCNRDYQKCHALIVKFLELYRTFRDAETSSVIFFKFWGKNTALSGVVDLDRFCLKVDEFSCCRPGTSYCVFTGGGGVRIMGRGHDFTKNWFLFQKWGTFFWEKTPTFE